MAECATGITGNIVDSSKKRCRHVSFLKQESSGQVKGQGRHTLYHELHRYLPLCPAEWPPTKQSSLTREGKHRYFQLAQCQPQLTNYPLNKHMVGLFISSGMTPYVLEYSCKVDVMFCFACRMFGAAKEH